ncbi:hypothetical protein [Neptuniibacter sp. QD37_11]|uniref:hypothetical protein n=1 Tax=Neptuniibacter sp. QD37_11 TaxID=3398209 RepID=UPI0039F51163
MGLIVNVYRTKDDGVERNCTAGGISSQHDELTLINVDGPFKPEADRPAALLVKGATQGHVIIVPADEIGKPRKGGMMGGNYAGTSDSRFSRAVKKISGGDLGRVAISIHDRFEY